MQHGPCPDALGGQHAGGHAGSRAALSRSSPLAGRCRARPGRRARAGRGCAGCRGCSPRRARPSRARRAPRPRRPRAAPRARPCRPARPARGSRARHVACDGRATRPRAGAARGVGRLARRGGVDRDRLVMVEHEPRPSSRPRSRRAARLRLRGRGRQRARRQGERRAAGPRGASSSSSGGCAARNGPRLSATTRSTVGGRGAEIAAECATNSSRWPIVSASFVSRSEAIVETLSPLSPAAQSEPPVWPRSTSTSSGSSASRRSEAKSASAPSTASTARSGRAASPIRSESPVSRWPSMKKHECSGRWPGVCITLDHGARRPSARRRPRTARGCTRPPPGGGSRLARRVEREAPVPGDVVGVVVRLEHADDPHARLLGRREIGLDRVGGSTTTASPAVSSPIR